MQQQVLTENERIRRQELTRNTRMALALNLSLDEFLEQRERVIADWTSWLYAEMGRLKADSPEEILPAICVRLEQRAVLAAREAAKAAATDMVKQMLRKAIA